MVSWETNQTDEVVEALAIHRRQKLVERLGDCFVCESRAGPALRPGKAEDTGVLRDTLLPAGPAQR